jgi:hypothetical protein
MTKRNSLVHRPRARASIASNLILNHVMSDKRTVREHAEDLHALTLRAEMEGLTAQLFREHRRLGITFPFSELVPDHDIEAYDDVVEFDGLKMRIYREFIFDDRKLCDWLADVPRLKRYVSERELSKLIIAL